MTTVFEKTREPFGLRWNGETNERAEEGPRETLRENISRLIYRRTSFNKRGRKEKKKSQAVIFASVLLGRVYKAADKTWEMFEMLTLA